MNDFVGMSSCPQTALQKLNPSHVAWTTPAHQTLTTALKAGLKPLVECDIVLSVYVLPHLSTIDFSSSC